MSEASERPSEQARPTGPGFDPYGKPGHPGAGVRHRNEAVLGPFTVRDLTLLGGVLITFIGSLLPLLQRNVLLNLWNAQNIFFLAIGFLLPAAAAGLFIWRRLEPHRSLRVGSLSVDQFASVVALLACTYYFVFTVTTFTPGAVVGLLGGVALVAATTAARVIPPFVGDFYGRAATPAHVVARDAVVPAHRPSGSKAPVPAGRDLGGEDASADEERSAAWFCSGWGSAASRAGTAAGTGAPAGATATAGTGAATGASAAAGPDAGAGVGGVGPRGTAGEARPTRPAESAPPAEPMEPAVPGRPAEAPAAAPARSESEEAVGPSADDVAEPDAARETAAAKEPSAPKEAGPQAPSGAAGIRAPESVDAQGPETVAMPPSPAGAGAGSVGYGERRDASVPERSREAEARPDREAALAAGSAPAGSSPAETASAESARVGSASDETARVGSAPAESGRSEPGEEAAATPVTAGTGRGSGRVDLELPEPESADSTPEGGVYGQADGEAYGAPEAPAPATAVFPAAAGRGTGRGNAGGAGGTESIGASRPFDEPAAHYEAFWFAVSQPRTAVDPMTGEPLFVLEPGEWILALQDRGHEFVVQNTDGRVGVLRELSGIERG